MENPREKWVNHTRRSYPVVDKEKGRSMLRPYPKAKEVA